MYELSVPIKIYAEILVDKSPYSDGGLIDDEKGGFTAGSV